jgi:hypothetical protein
MLILFFAVAETVLINYEYGTGCDLFILMPVLIPSYWDNIIYDLF